MKYHASFVIFAKVAKFEIVVCCKLQVALYDLKVCNGIKQHQQLTCPYFFVGISSVGIQGFHSMVCRSRSYSLLVLVIPNGTAVPPKCRI